MHHRQRAEKLLSSVRGGLPQMLGTHSSMLLHNVSPAGHCSKSEDVWTCLGALAISNGTVHCHTSEADAVVQQAVQITREGSGLLVQVRVDHEIRRTLDTG